MQYSAVLFSLSFFVIAEPAVIPNFEKTATKAIEKCLKTSNGTHPKIILDRIMAEETVNDHNFDCFMACFFDGVQFFEDDGSLNLDKISSAFPENYPNRDLITEVIKSCGDKKNEDKCSTAHALIQCAIEAKVPSLLQKS